MVCMVWWALSTCSYFGIKIYRLIASIFGVSKLPLGLCVLSSFFFFSLYFFFSNRQSYSYVRYFCSDRHIPPPLPLFFVRGLYPFPPIALRPPVPLPLSHPYPPASFSRKLLRIEEELGDKAVYSGKNFRKPSWMA